VPRKPFIEPSAPILRLKPPAGREWVHEVKHDGWRGQLHKAGDDVVVYSKTGADFTKRFRSIAATVLKLPVTSCILDVELDGTPHIMAPLEYRRHLLGKLLKRAKSDTLRMSENFRDPIALLKAAETHGLEGIVSKLREDRYRSGKNPGWIKVKTAAWRAANRERYKLFEK